MSQAKKIHRIVLKEIMYVFILAIFVRKSKVCIIYFTYVFQVEELLDFWATAPESLL